MKNFNLKLNLKENSKQITIKLDAHKIANVDQNFNSMRLHSISNVDAKSAQIHGNMMNNDMNMNEEGEGNGDGNELEGEVNQDEDVDVEDMYSKDNSNKNQITTTPTIGEKAQGAEHPAAVSKNVDLGDHDDCGDEDDHDIEEMYDNDNDNKAPTDVGKTASLNEYESQRDPKLATPTNDHAAQVWHD